MKILSWMQRKHRTSKQNSVSAKDHVLQESQKEEFCDWPNGLLAIGTFGNNNLKEDPDDQRCNVYENKCTSHVVDDHQGVTPEEVGELQKELKLLVLQQKQGCVESGLVDDDQLEPHNLQLDNEFNHPLIMSLEDHRTNSDPVCGDLANQLGQSQYYCNTSHVAVNRGKDTLSDQTNYNNAIGKKSLPPFLLKKKMFLTRSEFVPAPSLRDPLPQSRMEKILRAILHKKIYPQSSSPKYYSSRAVKKYLKKNYMPGTENDQNEGIDKANDGSKWVKTDSEFIVLEI